MRNIVVFGSTGSIGEQTLQVAAEFPDRVRVIGLAAHRQVRRLEEQVAQFKPRYAAVGDGSAVVAPTIQRGQQALIDMATAPDVDLVVMATVGAAGLPLTLAALDAGKLVALANKETLVMAGTVIRDQLSRCGELVPIDSEHSAIWQCLRGESIETVSRMVLTASGGAFRDFSAEQLKAVTPEQALRHPTWQMGPKITVDCATLMNKGLEVIEATFLFDVPMDRVEVILHRESIVHSLVYFADASVKAQLGLPDMRLPIQYALAHPDRWSNSLQTLDLPSIGELHFEAVNWDQYPCLRIAVEAGKRGGTYPAALCAADEVAVGLFLVGRISFSDISNLVEATLEKHVPCSAPNLDDILQTDALVRVTCSELGARF